MYVQTIKERCMVTSRDLFAALEFLLTSGADALVESAPIDRFALSALKSVESAAHSTSAQKIRAVPAKPKVKESHKPKDEHVLWYERAVKIAQEVTDVKHLASAMHDFKGCTLRDSTQNMVFADGPDTARLMFIGDGATPEDQRAGVPLAHEVGRFFDCILASVGLTRSQVYVTNIIPWELIEPQTLNQHAFAIMMPFMQRHIELVNPDLIVPLGGVATRTLLQKELNIHQACGKTVSLKTLTETYQAIPLYHPAYMLRVPEVKRSFWKSLLGITNFLRKKIK